MNISNYYKTIEKADVHNHFHLGGSQKLFHNMYPNSGIVFPQAYNGLPGMIDFIYNHLNTVMTTGKDVINFMNLSIESSIEDHVTYLEASVDVNLARFFDDSIETVINEVKRILNTYGTQIEFKPDIGINKDLDLEKVYAYTEACFDSGLFHGIDLYGKEANQELSQFIDLFKMAEDHGLKTKVHIGEFSDAQSIEDTIVSLNPREIQHGINAISSDRAIDMIIERGIRLNICPKSNVSLGAVNDLKTHPIRQLFDKGVKVSVNTDDLILFGSHVSDEFNDLVSSGLFSFEEAEEIRLNGFN